ncbi:MAG: hypothetical protein QOE82_2077, partial [Thermoanaerobaculia bacterium]|nr:hypothetical protein [Thermoanaerobaculia bacterium]
MYTLVCFVGVVRVGAADATRLNGLLDEAERMRASDKVRSRSLLDEVEREKPADPALVARVQLLECKWADVPAVAYRAVEAGLAATKSVGLRAKLMGCHANALLADGKPVDAEREYGVVAEMARQVGDRPLEAEATVSVGFLQYNRGAMADALANLQNAYRLSAQLGDEKGRLDALSDIANVYADAHVAQYDRAIEYYRQLVVEYEKHGQPSDVADTTFNIGSTF